MNILYYHFSAHLCIIISENNTQRGHGDNLESIILCEKDTKSTSKTKLEKGVMKLTISFKNFTVSKSGVKFYI